MVDRFDRPQVQRHVAPQARGPEIGVGTGEIGLSHRPVALGVGHRDRGVGRVFEHGVSLIDRRVEARPPAGGDVGRHRVLDHLAADPYVEERRRPPHVFAHAQLAPVEDVDLALDEIRAELGIDAVGGTFDLLRRFPHVADRQLIVLRYIEHVAGYGRDGYRDDREPSLYAAFDSHG